MTFAAFLDVPIAATTAESAVDLVLDAADGPATTFRLVNAGTLDAASKNPPYWGVLCGEGVNLADGRPLASVLAHTTARDSIEQVRGPWLFETCLDRGRERGLSHYFVGTTEDTLASLVKQVEDRFPGAKVAGTYAPPFSDRTPEEIAAQDHAIISSGANIVWVALGTPRQDCEALRITRSTGVTTAAVGAAFDYTAGTKKEAPEIFTRTHVEWLYRLAKEPRRLWRRYLVGNVRFARMCVTHARGRTL